MKEMVVLKPLTVSYAANPSQDQIYQCMRPIAANHPKLASSARMISLSLTSTITKPLGVQKHSSADTAKTSSQQWIYKPTKESVASSITASGVITNSDLQGSHSMRLNAPSLQSANFVKLISQERRCLIT